MAMFNSKLLVYQRVPPILGNLLQLINREIASLHHS